MTKKTGKVPSCAKRSTIWVRCYLYPALRGCRRQHEMMDKFDQFEGGMGWVVFSVKLKALLILWEMVATYRLRWYINLFYIASALFWEYIPCGSPSETSQSLLTQSFESSNSIIWTPSCALVSISTDLLRLWILFPQKLRTGKKIIALLIDRMLG